nr:integrase, catalytic region, zinc finger, CCHC-type, peptidase aspartic, catalytic [Tanacetum cinerariifolium]
MLTQQDIYAAGSENRPPMLNKENYVPWFFRILRYAKSRPNGKLIHNSIINGPYVRRMIPEPGDTNRKVPVNETFHVQTDDELTEKELKQSEADDQAIQTILLGLSEDIYAAVDSCETAQEIWLRVQQMMKGSDIGIQEKKAKLFNEWERFTSIDGESIESYYHRFLKLMNDLKRNKHFSENIASNLKFLNNLQPEWSRHVTIVHQTNDLHTADYTQLYDFLKYNQKEVDELKAERLAKTQDPLALMATSNNPYTFLVLYQDQPSFNQNYMQQPMPNPEDITDPTTAMNMALALMAKAFKLNYSTPTNNNQRISSNPHNRQIAQPGMNMGQDGQMQMVRSNGENQFRQYDGQYVGNLNGYNDVQNVRNQQASTSGTQTDKAPVYDSDGSSERGTKWGTVEQHPTNVEETRVLYDSLHQNLAIEVEKVNTVNRKLKETNAELTTELARFKNQEKCFEISQEKYDKLERCYQKFVYQEQCLSKKINALHLRRMNMLNFGMIGTKSVKKYDKAYNDMQQKIERLQAQLGDLIDNTKTRRPQPRSNTKNDRVPSASKSSCNKNTGVEAEEHHRNLLLSKNKKHMSSECNNVKLDSQNVNYKVVCAMCKQCLKSVNHDVCLLNYVNGKTSRGKKQKANVSINEKKKKQKPNVKKNNKVGFIERLATPKPSKPRSFLRWSPTGRVFDLKGKIIASSESKSQSDYFKGDNACTSNPLEPTIKRFPNLTFSFVGLGHNLFLVRQFCDSNLEVAFRRNACFVRNLEGVNLLSGNRTTNLYTINLHEMASASPIFLMARASSTKSWLWHQRLSHLNFDTINDLAKNNRVLGLPKFKYHKEHLCPSCEQGKSKRTSHPPKPVLNSRQRLHLLHMDLCGLMRIASINRKHVSISHQVSSIRTPQQNGVVERRNRTLVEAARTMLIFSRAPLFLWAEAIATACFTQNRSIIHRRFNKTPYELINERKSDISFLHVFGALCYPKNDREDIVKLGAKGDIGFFIGYSPNSCAYRIYNQRTKKIIETMNVSFDELSAMAFEQRSSKPRLQSMTFGQISSGLDLTYALSTITTQQPTEGELDLLFEAMYDDYIGGQPLATLRTDSAAQAHQVRQTSTTSTSIADIAPMPTNSSFQATNFPISSQDVDELNSQQQHVQQQGNKASLQPKTVADNILNAMFDAHTFVNPFATPSISAAESSFSQYVDPSNMHTFYQPYPHEFSWVKASTKSMGRRIVDVSPTESLLQRHH